MRFDASHPIVLLFYFINVFWMTMFILHPVFLGISLFCASIVAMLVNVHALHKFVKFMVPTSVVLVIMNPIINQSGETVLFSFLGRNLTLEATLYGVAMTSMLFSVLIWFITYNAWMGEDKIYYLCSRVLPIWALTITISLRFIPRLIEEIEQIEAVQKTYGAVQMNTRLETVKEKFKLLLTVLSLSLERAVDTANSMKARGYGVTGRTSFTLFKWRKNDTWFLLWMVFLCMGIVWGVWNGSMSFDYYPKTQGFSFDREMLFYYVNYGLFLLTPLFKEGKEMRKWSKSNFRR